MARFSLFSELAGLSFFLTCQILSFILLFETSFSLLYEQEGKELTKLLNSITQLAKSLHGDLTVSTLGSSNLRCRSTLVVSGRPCRTDRLAGRFSAERPGSSLLIWAVEGPLLSSWMAHVVHVPALSLLFRRTVSLFLAAAAVCSSSMCRFPSSSMHRRSTVGEHLLRDSMRASAVLFFCSPLLLFSFRHP